MSLQRKLGSEGGAAEGFTPVAPPLLHRLWKTTTGACVRLQAAMPAPSDQDSELCGLQALLLSKPWKVRLPLKRPLKLPVQCS
mmetsp:Transcript_50023/g.131827  ORF Transcript_50023/g.131827 Transcript_50023/m.131827 type:complete len:83 (-) Transcript_50023:14-262(-)